MKVLVLAFPKFGGYDRNPTEIIARQINGRCVGGAKIVAAVLSATYRDAPVKAIELILQHEPVAILGLGFSSDVQGITFETLWWNEKSSDYRDEIGECWHGEPIDPGGPKSYGITADIAVLCDLLNANRIPFYVSNDAGRFICNALGYGIGQHLERTGKGIPFAYIRIPATDRCPRLVDPTKKVVMSHDIAVLAVNRILGAMLPARC